MLPTSGGLLWSQETVSNLHAHLVTVALLHGGRYPNAHEAHA